MRGFTLIELLVVIGVFVVISAMVLANYPGFITSLNLGNVSKDIASVLRQAESYAMGVRAFTDRNNDIVFPPYGVHFENQQPNKFIIFADTNGNSLYDSINRELVQEFILNKVKIADLCVNYDSSPPDTILCDRMDIDIVFKRPDPAINIKSQGTGFSNGAVIVESAGKQSAVIFWISGQIYVKKL